MSDSWEIAAWRFEMISPLLDKNLSGAHKRRILRERTKRAVQWPSSEGGPIEKPIGRSTLLRWLKSYRDEGFVGLLPKVRKDKGLTRDDRSLYVDYALGLLYEQPERSLTQSRASRDSTCSSSSHSCPRAAPPLAGIFTHTPPSRAS